MTTPKTIKLTGFADERDVFIDGVSLSPKKSQIVWNHSPDGFNWGYHGSGPAQLALAILLEFFDRDFAERNHQEFKRRYIANLPLGEDFDIQIPITEFKESYESSGL